MGLVLLIVVLVLLLGGGVSFPDYRAHAGGGLVLVLLVVLVLYALGIIGGGHSLR